MESARLNLGSEPLTKSTSLERTKMRHIDLSLSGGRLGSPGPTPTPEHSCGEQLWPSKGLGDLADRVVMEQLTRFPFPYPLDDPCSGSGDERCEGYNDKLCNRTAYSKPITKFGRYLREIWVLCETCRNRLEANREIKIRPSPAGEGPN